VNNLWDVANSPENTNKYCLVPVGKMTKISEKFFQQTLLKPLLIKNEHHIKISTVENIDQLLGELMLLKLK